MNVIYFGNTLHAWSIAFAIAAIGFIVLVLIQQIALGRIKTFASSTATLTDDLAYQVLFVTRRYFLLTCSVYAATFALDVGAPTRLILHRGFVLICLVQASLWGSKSISFWIDHYLKKRSLTDASFATSVGLIGFSAKFALFSIIALTAVHNLGFNIATLIAGLGVGGIAVALAVQNILGDLFASLTIVLDKPFVVGDFIIVDEFMGTIEHIGLKTTRIRSLSGEQLIFPNGNLLQSRVRNYKRMNERRVPFIMSVPVTTSLEKLKLIPGIVTEIIKATPRVRFDRCHLMKIGATLDYETVYWVTDADFNVYADIAQSIHFEILKRFREEEVVLAYPPQTVFVQNVNNATS